MRLTQAELWAMATERFGSDASAWAFKCPACGDVAAARDFKEAGAALTFGMTGQECIGRSLRSVGAVVTRGCQRAAYGLIRGPWEVVVPAEGDKPEQSIWCFPLAEVSP